MIFLRKNYFLFPSFIFNPPPPGDETLKNCWSKFGGKLFENFSQMVLRQDSIQQSDADTISIFSTMQLDLFLRFEWNISVNDISITHRKYTFKYTHTQPVICLTNLVKKINFHLFVIAFYYFQFLKLVKSRLRVWALVFSCP